MHDDTRLTQHYCYIAYQIHGSSCSRMPKITWRTEEHTISHFTVSSRDLEGCQVEEPGDDATMQACTLAAKPLPHFMYSELPKNCISIMSPICNEDEGHLIIKSCRSVNLSRLFVRITHLPYGYHRQHSGDPRSPNSSGMTFASRRRPWPPRRRGLFSPTAHL